MIKSGADFSKIAKDFEKFRKGFPTFAGRQGVNFFKNNFTLQGFLNEPGQVKPWAKRKPNKQGKDPRPGAAILIKSGAGRRSITFVAVGNTIRFLTPFVYMKAHNDGFEGDVNVGGHTRTQTIKRRVKGSYDGIAKRRRTATVELAGKESNVSGHTRHMKIPQRQFAGESKSLMKTIEYNAVQALKAILK